MFLLVDLLHSKSRCSSPIQSVRITCTANTPVCALDEALTRLTRDTDIHFLGDLTFDLEKWRKRFDIVPNKGTGVPYMMIEYLLVSIISEDNWSYEIEVLGNKTNFKGSSNIAAGLKLSQGSFSAE